MKRAAIGVRMHSGWGALVAVSLIAGKVEVIDRRRIVVASPGTPGAIQPYHYAKARDLHEAEAFLANSLVASETLARTAIQNVLSEIGVREYRVVGAAVLLASGRPLPPLPTILASHALTHAAEGEFFRAAFRNACEGLNISVAGFRERDLEERFEAAFDKAATRTSWEVSILGRTVGPPWTKDQKLATTAALIVFRKNED
jgi:hypothetical protein